MLPLESGVRKCESVIDATEFAPICPQPIRHLEDQPNYLREDLRPLKTLNGRPVMDVANCLTLNIYTPPGAIKPGAKRQPVFVWIHGGGWTIGDRNTSGDCSFFVRKGIEIEKPFVAVAINYRLGFHGFLSSKELIDEAKAHGETFSPNNGLLDQRLALQWARKYIHYFGGDDEDVTISGESAGGWCVFAHLQSDVPVCRRAVIQSAPAFKFKPLKDTRARFDHLVSLKGISASASAAEKLAALRCLTDEECNEGLEGVFARPIWDPEWFVLLDKETPMEHTTKFPERVQGVVVGSTKHEMALWEPSFAHLTSSSMEKFIYEISPELAFADELLKAYNVGRQYSQEDSLGGILAMGTDGAFGCLPPLLGDIRSTPVSIYPFDQVDSFPQSQLKDFAYHSVDIYYLFRPPRIGRPEADPDSRSTADQMTETWSQFIYGHQPWSTFPDEHKIMIYEGSMSRWLIGLRVRPVGASAPSSTQNRGRRGIAE